MRENTEDGVEKELLHTWRDRSRWTQGRGRLSITVKRHLAVSTVKYDVICLQETLLKPSRTIM